jgi:glycerol-3-phosphate dehydrogenase
LSAPELDVLVIGGGIHGVGVAQAAAARGHSTLVVEQSALAAGTSSRSSKLIHGGLRYLESFQLGLVHESVAERELLLCNAPSLVRLVPFIIPIYDQTSRGPRKVRAGLSLYALLGGLHAHSRFAALPREEWDSLDGLTTDGLRAVFRYFDGQTDDAALCRAVMRSALELGAELACPARFVGAELRAGGYTVAIREGDAERTLAARTVVNAAGPWVEDTRALVSPLPPGMAIELVRGTHIELSGNIERGIYYAEAPADRRAVFTMPWRGHTLVGTTEARHDGPPADVAPSAEEIEYLQATFTRHFPGRSTDVRDSWAGLRVLPAATGAAFSRPRETHLIPDDRAFPRWLGLYGGKLTGYRATAEKVLDRLRPSLPVRPRVADTRRLSLTAD